MTGEMNMRQFSFFMHMIWIAAVILILAGTARIYAENVQERVAGAVAFDDGSILAALADLIFADGRVPQPCVLKACMGVKAPGGFDENPESGLAVITDNRGTVAAVAGYFGIKTDQRGLRITPVCGHV